MAWWRSGAPRDGDSSNPPRSDRPLSEWERSPWSRRDDEEQPPPGPDVLSSAQPIAGRRRSAPNPAWDPPPPLPSPESEPELETAPETAEEEPEAPRTGLRGWYQERKTTLIPLAAIVVGALVGGASIHSFDTQRAAQARRDTVNLSARVAEETAPQTTAGSSLSWVLRLIVTNSGETNIRISAATLVDARFQSQLREVSEDTQIRSGQESWVSLDVTNSCVDGGPAPAPQKLELTVIPEGRPTQRVAVRLSDDSDQMVDSMRQNCLNPDTDIWTDAELDGRAVVRGDTLNVPVRLHLVGPEALAVRQIRTNTPGLSVVAAPLPVRFTHGITAQTTLRWTVASCPRAKVVTYAEIGISATVMLLADGEAIVSDAVLDANAVLAIVRFITTTCR